MPLSDQPADKDTSMQGHDSVLDHRAEPSCPVCPGLALLPSRPLHSRHDRSRV